MLRKPLFVAYSTLHGAARLETESIVGGDLVVRVGGGKHPRLHGAQHQSRRQAAWIAVTAIPCDHELRQWAPKSSQRYLRHEMCVCILYVVHPGRGCSCGHQSPSVSAVRVVLRKHGIRRPLRTGKRPELYKHCASQAPVRVVACCADGGQS